MMMIDDDGDAVVVVIYYLSRNGIESLQQQKHYHLQKKWLSLSVNLIIV